MKLSHVLLLSVSLLSFQAHAMEAPEDEGRPHEHYCPISLQVMKDPVVAEDEHSYEREEILKWFTTGHTNSPLNGSPLDSQKLISNQALKTMILDWKPGIQSGPSVLATKSAADIAQLIREEFAKNEALLNSAKGQHIVAVLGNTGAGKSTLVNLLAGKEIRVSDDGEDYVLVHPEDREAMVIGTSGNSETLYPKSIDVDGLRVFDFPGFDDTDGSVRNLVNAAFTRKILLDAASVRIVFAVGQDQFTADRSASVRRMFNGLKQLFVVGQGVDLVDNGIFVATKVTCAPQTEITDFLLKKTNSQDKAELNAQLQAWSKEDKLCRVFHPLRKDSNQGVRNHILEQIKRTKPVKVDGINISALYPSDTQKDLERVFLDVLENEFVQKLTEAPITLSDYDKASLHYKFENFWPAFGKEVCQKDDAVSLLKEFCSLPYSKALRALEQRNNPQRQQHLKDLEAKRQERVKDIETRTAQKTKNVIASLVPIKTGDQFVTFDFAYHRDFHEQVCGADVIGHLATDLQEQNVVRSHYAGLISEHSHQQMMNWHEKFVGGEKLITKIFSLEKQLEEAQRKLLALDPLIKEQEAAQAREARQLQRIMQEEQEEQRKRQEQKLAEEKRLAKLRRGVPTIAWGHEKAYKKFLNGRLIYRPNVHNDYNMIELKIADLANPLEETFDLSQCRHARGDAEQYLSISTGYKKDTHSKDKKKLEVWFVPRFLVEKEINGSARHFKDIFPDGWPENVSTGIIWTMSGCRMDDYDHLTHVEYTELNLAIDWRHRHCPRSYCNAERQSTVLDSTFRTAYSNRHDTLQYENIKYFLQCFSYVN